MVKLIFDFRLLDAFAVEPDLQSSTRLMQLNDEVGYAAAPVKCAVCRNQYVEVLIVAARSLRVRKNAQKDTNPYRETCPPDVRIHSGIVSPG
jgi:hypothetical protein